MSATAAMEIGSDLWNARMYAGLSLASELAAGLHRSKRVASSLFYVWKMYWQLDQLNNSLEKFAVFDPAASSSKVATPEDYRRVRDSVLRLYELCTRLLSPQDDFDQRGLMSKKLARLQVQSESLLDVADWLDAMSTPEENEAKFAAALEDLVKGDVVPWAAVQ
jgi:hypothetical protein